MLRFLIFLIWSTLGVILLSPTRLSAQLTKVHPPTEVLQMNHISCYGDASGLIEVGFDPAHEIQNLEWLRNGELVGRTLTASNLSQGLYQLRYEINASKVEQVFRIKAPRPLSFEYQLYRVADQDTYNIDLIPIGGNAPYQFFNDKGRSFKKDSISSGVHTVMVRDANGCSFTQNILVGDAIYTETFAIVEKIKCFGDGNGSVKVGSNESQQVVWADGYTKSKRSGMSKGVYTFIKSKSNLELEQKVWVEEAAPITVAIKETNDLVNPGLEVFISGGTGDHSFVWNDGLKSKKRNVHHNGLYRFLVVDQNGCKVEAMVDVEIDPFMGFIDSNLIIKQ